MHASTTLPGTLELGLERLWLRLLPAVMRSYRWVRVGGLDLYGSAHHQVFLYRLLKGSFEPYTVQIFQEAIEPGMIVLDIGAYIGYYSLLAAGRVGPRGKVYAFECDPRNYRFLLHNIHLNESGRHVAAVRKAIGRETGVLPFHLYRSDASQSSLWHKRGKGSTIDVECTTIDDMLKGQPVDLIKMDIEGGEIHALKGMEETLRRSERVTLLLECHPEALESAGGSAEVLVEELERLGFRAQIIDEQHRRLRPFGDEIDATRRGGDKRYVVNLLARK